MQELRCEEIIEALMELISGNINTIFAGISPDSKISRIYFVCLESGLMGF